MDFDMHFTRLQTALVATALTLTPAASQAGDALVGGIIGGIIGGAIANSANHNAAPRRTTTRTYKAPRSGISAAQRASNREVQVALNYFGFPVGTPDGSIGPKSRAAISQYQVQMGFAPSGNLNAWEQDLLVQSFYRAQAGGVMTAQQVASDPRGVQGLLFTYRDEKLGVGAAPGGQMAAMAAPAPAAIAPLVAAAPDVPSLPFFIGQPATQVSLASHCNKISLVTNSNGGFVTKASLSDPGFALSEQFCLARTYAITQGEELGAKVAGFTPQQIAEQCAGFAPVMAPHVAALSSSPAAAVLQGVAGFVAGSGMTPDQLAGTAKICLGVGYVTDNMDVAIGSALVLTAVGQGGYAELAGHHLAAGIGAAQRMDLALPWFDAALDAGGAVFAPGMAERPDLIRTAAYAAAGRPLAPAPVVVPAALPSFAAAPAPAAP
jgi:peptidoglycan hydrolase-like protein with peptidoglycan-binding domain